MLPELLSYGMFFDGVTYATISRNLAQGLGSFWSPYYTEIIYPEFHEHPPLVFGIQSLFFRLFGDLFYLEKVYSLLCLLLVMLAMTVYWKQNIRRDLFALPLIIFLTIPVITWSFRNNLLENTMTIFTTFSVFFFVNGVRKNRIVSTLIGSLFCFLAFLSKGPVGLFPLSTITIYMLFYGKSNQLIKHLMIQLLSFTIITALSFVLLMEAYENIVKYFEQQVIASLMNKREFTTGYRFRIIGDLILELGIALITCVVVVIKREYWRKLEWREILFHLAIASAASLPLMLSLKQSKFYLVPSLPFYAIVVAMILAPYVSSLTIKRPKNFVQISRYLVVAVISLTLLIMARNFESFSRDKEILSCVLEKPAKTQKILAGSNHDCYNWTLVAYMMRYRKISISCDSTSDPICN